MSLQTLEEPDVDHRAGLPATLAHAGARPAAVALSPAQPLKLPVPVPPRGEGGLVGTVSSAFVLGAEILGALLTGPVLALLRGSQIRSDAEMDYATAVIWRYTGHYSGKDGWDREPLVRIPYGRLSEAEKAKDRDVWKAVRDALKARPAL